MESLSLMSHLLHITVWELNIIIPYQGTIEDDFPCPQVGYVSSPQGTPAMSSWKVCAVGGHWQVALSLYSEMCEVRQDLQPNALTLPDVVEIYVEIR